MHNLSDSYGAGHFYRWLLRVFCPQLAAVDLSARSTTPPSRLLLFGGLLPSTSVEAVIFFNVVPCGASGPGFDWQIRSIRVDDETIRKEQGTFHGTSFDAA